jgi:hypothetical protein
MSAAHALRGMRRIGLERVAPTGAASVPPLPPGEVASIRAGEGISRGTNEPPHRSMLAASPRRSKEADLHNGPALSSTGRLV